MIRMQRYIFAQTARTLVVLIAGLALLALLGQALSRTDVIVESRQSALVYFKVVLLGAPQVISLLLPLALFTAAVWTLNRIHRDSEIVVVQAVGMTDWQVAAPVIRLAAIAALAQLALNLWGQPLAQTELRETLREARTSLISTLIRPGQFTHAGDDLTFFAEDAAGGELRGIVISDLSNPNAPVEYLAARGRAATINGEPTVVMRDGQILQTDEAGALRVLDFEQYAFSLADFAAAESDLILKASDRPLDRLFFIDRQNYFETRNANRFLAEGHNRLSTPLLNLAMAAIAIAAVFGGDFSRRGFSRRIAWATGAALGLLILHMMATSAAVDAPAANALQWTVPLLGFAVAIGGPTAFRGRRTRRLKAANAARDLDRAADADAPRAAA